MNRSTMTPTPTTPADLADTSADDHRLQQALRELPPPGADAARLAALQQRVLADWQQAHPARQAEAVLVGGGAVAGALGLPRRVVAGPGRRRWLLGTGLMLGGAALALGVWLRQPDPLLEELAQPDVLSQMAIGEM